MKKLLTSSIIFSILIITACSAQQSSEVIVTLEVIVTSLPPSETPLPTPSPESLLPQEVKEKFDQAGIDLKDMTNAKYDKDGLSITLESGEVVLLTNEELEKGIYNGQDNVLQYRDEANQNVIYAFDKESGKWVVTPEGQLSLDLKRWGIAPDKYNVGYDKDGKIELRDKATNKLIYWDGKWSSDVVVDMVVATNDCQSTKFPQAPGINMPPKEMWEDFEAYFKPYLQKIVFSLPTMAYTRMKNIYLTGSDNCWGIELAQYDENRTYLFWLDTTEELQSLEYFDAKLYK